jgi:PKD repeat protein
VASASTTVTLTSTRAVAAGDGVLVAVLLGSTSTAAVNVTDSAGNLYLLDREQNDGSGGDRTLVFSASNARALPSGGTIKVTYPQAAQCHVVADEFSGISALDKTASASATATAFTSGTTATISQPVELIYGAVGIESGSAPTWGSGFTALTALAIGSDRLGSAYRISSVTGPYAATGSSGGTWMAIVVTFTSGPPPELPPAAALSVTKAASPPLAVTADASASTDVDLTPIATYRFNFGDGTAAVTTTAPTASAAHTYASSGTYTVTLIVTDTGNRASTPVTATVTVSNDSPPVAKLTLTQTTSALTIDADGAGSTDVDATPIASYRFDFGDGTAVVTKTPPVTSAQHTYGSPGTYTVRLTVTDTGGNATTVTASISETAPNPNPGGSKVAVYAGYYDTHHTSHLQTKPSPWRTASNVVFIGTPDPGTTDGWDTSCVRIDNLTGVTMSGVVVTVNIGSKTFALWGTNTIPAGKILIVAQTGFENFDGSDTSPAGCYGCDPKECTTLVSSTIPVVHVTIGGSKTDYYDVGQTLNTHGVDQAGCPATGTRNDESQAWKQIFPRAAAAAGSAPAVEDGWQQADAAAGNFLWLAAPMPNPSHGPLGIQFRLPARGPVRLGVYDIGGRLVRTSLDAVLEAGDHSEQLDLSAAPAGIYFCRLSTPERTLRGTFVLVR